ncbi:hypothetical protein A1O7_07927 [Cladophialophora yegresii CBS 114405]|uniref:Uncharacterized protein n=1 Tax=Cladophialophora yegresii CBS 114405 TaxID=1182544 RepID=W9WGD3_9EURO|nr:uncharacterized protein A1O7_07927 [Cladophialophora yegresii CBS 114405]EXJ57579.1 hypothetical protein A1O7_07927 [Cladophialophora yegresii CBS 114405]
MHIAETLGISENKLWGKLRDHFPEEQKSIRAEAKDSTEFFGFLNFIEMIMAKFCQSHEPKQTRGATNEAAIMQRNVPTIKKFLAEMHEGSSLGEFDDADGLEQTDVFLSQILIDAVITTALIANKAKDIACYSGERSNKVTKVLDVQAAESLSYHRRAQASDVLTWHLAQPFVDYPDAGLCSTICALFVRSLVVRINSILGSCQKKAFKELSKCETRMTLKLKTANPLRSRADLAEFKALDDAALSKPQALALARKSHAASIAAIKKTHGGKLTQTPEGMIAPSPDPEFLAKHNPILCGIRLLSFKHAIETAGITIANNHLSIMQAATMVNVMHQMRYVTIEWSDLDRAMSLQTSNVFIGTIPTTPALAHKVYIRRSEFSLAGFEQMRRGLFPEDVPLHRPGYAYPMRISPDGLKVTEATAIFDKLYDGTETMLRTVYALKTEAEKRQSKDVPFTVKDNTNTSETTESKAKTKGKTTAHREQYQSQERRKRTHSLRLRRLDRAISHHVGPLPRADHRRRLPRLDHPNNPM